MLNKATLIGRLGRDPEIRYTQNGTPICTMRVATDESYTGNDGQRVEKTEWHTVVAFQRQAENCQVYLGKGSLIYAEGSLQTRKWQDQQGQDRYSTEIKASRVLFLDRKTQDGQPQQPRRPPREQGEPDDPGPAFPSEAAGGFDDGPF